MQLYRSRDFSAYFQDTFSFVKQNGGHFFKHFFIVNGVFLLILMVLGYFFMKFYTEIIFGGVLQNNPNVFDGFMNSNSGLFLFLLILFIISSIVFGVFIYAYPVFYLKLYNSKGGKKFGTAELITAYKNNLSRLIVYIFASILIGIPLTMVAAVLVFALFITLIGIILVPFAIAVFSLFYIMALMEYMEGERSIWDSYSYSWKLLSSKFIASVGSVGIFYLMSYLVQNVITLIAYIFGMVRMFTTVEDGNPNPEDFSGTMSIIMIITFMAGFLLGSILNSIVVLNQGIIYYSLKEDNESINTKSIIDQIGSGE